jgi:hypothetical protein
MKLPQNKNSTRFALGGSRSSRSFSYAEPEINLIACIDVLMKLI